MNAPSKPKHAASAHETGTTKMNMIQAINSAMDVMLGRDPNVLIYGEDVGYFGGVFNATEGLQKKYGLNRCFDAPIAEAGLIGTAVGMGAYGLRPCVEIQFADYIYPGYDQIVSEAARLRYRSAGDFWCPLTIRTPYGGGIFGGQTHSQSPEALFTHVAGLKVLIPSTPYDAKGLLTPWQKIEDNNVPNGHYVVPLGKARIARPGNEVTVLAYGTMVHVAVASAEQAGVDAEVIDLRTLVPVDIDAIVTSVKKTGRCVVVHEATRTSGFGAELIALIQEHCFYHLEAPIERVTGWDTPYPHAFEWEYFPGPARVGAALKRVMEA